MSTIYEDNCLCGVCGETTTVLRLGSTSILGAADLDFRPPLMQRNTMRTWVDICKYCGYVSDNLSKVKPMTADFIKTERYKNCDDMPVKTYDAKNFVRYAMLNEIWGEVHAEFSAYLTAAWNCDDYESEVAGAIACRQKCLALENDLLKIIGDDDNVKEGVLLQICDIMRRLKKFDELIEKFSDMNFIEEEKSQVVAFHIAKAKEKDSACYTFSDVFDEE